jgi:hypothetical protein
MIRTQLYLPKSLMQRIALEALKAQKPKAEIVRELLQESLERRKADDAPSALQSLATLGKQLKARGPADLSERLDDYLYAD